MLSVLLVFCILSRNVLVIIALQIAGKIASCSSALRSPFPAKSQTVLKYLSLYYEAQSLNYTHI